MLHRLQGLGLSARIYEAGDGVGGVGTDREKCDAVAAKRYEGFTLTV